MKWSLIIGTKDIYFVVANGGVHKPFKSMAYKKHCIPTNPISLCRDQLLLFIFVQSIQAGMQHRTRVKHLLPSYLHIIKKGVDSRSA
jgi:hypothetical protein